MQRVAHFIAAQELLLKLRDPAIALLDLRLEDDGSSLGAPLSLLADLLARLFRMLISKSSLFSRDLQLSSFACRSAFVRTLISSRSAHVALSH